MNKIKVKPLDVITHNYIEGILRAYLKGKKTWNWAIGVINAQTPSLEEFDSIVSRFSAYRERPRFADLAKIRQMLPQ